MKKLIKRLLETISLNIALLLGGAKFGIEKAFESPYFNLASVVIAVIGGLIAQWIAWAWLMLYFILWSNFVNLKKEK